MLDLAFDYNRFHERVRDAARVAFRRLQVDHAGERFYVFALHATADHGTLCVLADSEEALTRATREQHRKHAGRWYRGISADELRLALRYGVGEYFCPPVCAAAFAEVNAIAAARSRALFDIQKMLQGEFGEHRALELLAPHRSAFASACVGALKLLEAEGVFGRRDDRHRALVTFLNGEVYHEAYLRHAIDLNPPGVIERFLDEMVAAAEVSQAIQDNLWRSAEM